MEEEKARADEERRLTEIIASVDREKVNIEEKKHEYIMIYFILLLMPFKLVVNQVLHNPFR